MMMRTPMRQLTCEEFLLKRRCFTFCPPLFILRGEPPDPAFPPGRPGFAMR